MDSRADLHIKTWHRPTWTPSHMHTCSHHTSRITHHSCRPWPACSPSTMLLYTVSCLQVQAGHATRVDVDMDLEDGWVHCGQSAHHACMDVLGLRVKFKAGFRVWPGFGCIHPGLMPHAALPAPPACSRSPPTHTHGLAAAIVTAAAVMKSGSD